MSVDNTFGPTEALRRNGSGSLGQWEEIAQSLYTPGESTALMIPRRNTIDENGILHHCPLHDQNHELTQDYLHLFDSILEGTRPHRQEARERTAAVADTAIAASNGDLESLETSVGNAFKKMHGDPEKFKKYAAQLQEELKAEGIDVRFSGNTIAFHKQGEPLAVELQLQSNNDGRNPSVRAQPYDWHTKQDVQGKNAWMIVGAFNPEYWSNPIIYSSRASDIQYK